MTLLNSPIKKFDDWNHFDNFLHQLKQSSDWKELDNFHSGVINLGFVKFYFQEINTGEIWELTEPDPPLRGSWHKFESQQIN